MSLAEIVTKLWEFGVQTVSDNVIKTLYRCECIVGSTYCVSVGSKYYVIFGGK